MAATTSQPGYTDALAGMEIFDRRANGLYLAHYLVSRHQGQLGFEQVAVDYMQVGAANAAGGDAQQHLLRPGGG
jgi:hypothetical protein